MSGASTGLKTRFAKSFHHALLTIGATGVLVLLVAVVPATSASAAPSRTMLNTPRGSLLATLSDPGATSDDVFGYRSAAAETTVVVGAPGAISDEGVVYIYEKGVSGWPSAPTATLTDPAATSDDEFGYSVAVAVTGTTVIVGAPGTISDEGVVYIYEKSASGWPTTPTATLTDPAATSEDLFGYSVAVSRYTAMTVVVGAPGTSTAIGAAYIYVNGATGWPTTPTTTLADPADTSEDIFGFAVAVSGQTAVISAPFNLATGEGVTYVYVNGGTGWPTTPTATMSDPAATEGDHFGYSVTVARKNIVVGDPYVGSEAGAGYIYVRGTSGWPATPTTTLSVPADALGFGWSVSVSDGRAAVGAPLTSSAATEAGAAYFYVEGASAWSTTPTTSISDPAATSSDEFGYTVAVSGKAAVVGAPYTNTGAGTAYIYKI